MSALSRGSSCEDDIDLVSVRCEEFKFLKCKF